MGGVVSSKKKPAPDTHSHTNGNGTSVTAGVIPPSHLSSPSPSRSGSGTAAVVAASRGVAPPAQITVTNNNNSSINTTGPSATTTTTGANGVPPTSPGRQLSRASSAIALAKASVKRTRRAGIRGERSGDASETEVKVVAKSDEARNLIERTIKAHYLFSSLNDSEVRVIADAMSPLKVQKGFEVMRQGDQGDFFYVIEEGEYDVIVNGVAVDVAKPETCSGELALMFGQPRTATVVSKGDGVLWRLGRKEFRAAMNRTTDVKTTRLLELLSKVAILKDLREYQRMRIAEALQPVTFAKGDTIQQAGEVGTHLYLITQGKVLLTADGNQLQSTHSFVLGADDAEEDSDDRKVDALQQTLGVGDVFGERSLLLDEPLKHTAQAEEDVLCYTMDRASFDALMGPLRDLLARVQDLRLLESIPILQKLTEKERQAVINAFEFRHYADGEYIIRQNEVGDAFYVVKSGSVVVSRNAAKSHGPAESFVLRRVAGEYFGEMALIDAGPRAGNVVAEGRVTVARLERENFEQMLGPLRLILERDTTSLRARIRDAQSPTTRVAFTDLQIKRTLGAGAFGQVKLVTYNGQNFALKCLRRSEVIRLGQQMHVRSELEIMSMLQHPMVMKLIQSFKDDKYVYMMLELIQGGELFHRISSLDTALSSDHARFYAANVVDALEYVHDLDIIYRDLKPENILIDAQGYLKIVDFGCAKVVKGGRTHTLCGSPEYVAPEVLLGKGYNAAVDIWSLGVLVYELAVGFSPFNPSQNLGHLQVCSNIIQGNFTFPRAFSNSRLKEFIRGLLSVDPNKRLGRLAGGYNDIRRHPWFEGFDWDEMRARRMVAPWVPPIKDANDMSMFDSVEEEPRGEDDPSSYSDDCPGWDMDF